MVNLIDAGIKIGQRVFSYEHGWGRVTAVLEDEILPIEVKFKSSDEIVLVDRFGRLTYDDPAPSIELFES